MVGVDGQAVCHRALVWLSEGPHEVPNLRQARRPEPLALSAEISPRRPPIPLSLMGGQETKHHPDEVQLYLVLEGDQAGLLLTLAVSTRLLPREGGGAVEEETAHRHRVPRVDPGRLTGGPGSAEGDGGHPAKEQTGEDALLKHPEHSGRLADVYVLSVLNTARDKK